MKVYRQRLLETYQPRVCLQRLFFFLIRAQTPTKRNVITRYS